MGSKSRNKKPKRGNRIRKYIIQRNQKRMYHLINYKNYDISKDYIKFFNNLETKSQFITYKSSIVPFSKQWMAIRSKRITSSNVNNILKWTMKTNYIHNKIRFYVNSDSSKRGKIMHEIISILLNIQNKSIIKNDEIWIHRNIRWLSSIPDCLIKIKNKPICTIEIKTSIHDPLKNIIKISEDGNYELKSKNHQIYNQMQMQMEVLNVFFGYLIFEHNGKIYTLFIKRDLNYLHDIFENLFDKYFRYLIPYYIYGPIKDRNGNTLEKSTNYISKKKSEYLLEILDQRTNEIKNLENFEELFFYNAINLEDEKDEIYDFFDLEETQKKIEIILKNLNTKFMEKMIKKEIKEINKYYKNNTKEELKKFENKLKE